ncbi:MAG: U32 family peptidase, partial [Nanoarchaeota archaeon]|nr:U32 family peptidase [Nanoarchaeota archaeon]
KILDTGISVLKIEGRGRSPDYVYTTVKAYREAADAYLAGEFTEQKGEDWVKELETVFNRGFWHGGYYLGHKLGEWCNVYGSKATKEKRFVGTVKNYFQKANVAEVYLESEGLKVGDDLIITGSTTGVVKAKVKSIRVSGSGDIDDIRVTDDQDVTEAEKGSSVTIHVKEKLRAGDKVYLLVDRS